MMLLEAVATTDSSEGLRQEAAEREVGDGAPRAEHAYLSLSTVVYISMASSRWPCICSTKAFCTCASASARWEKGGRNQCRHAKTLHDVAVEGSMSARDLHDGHLVLDLFFARAVRFQCSPVWRKSLCYCVRVNVCG